LDQCAREGPPVWTPVASKALRDPDIIKAIGDCLVLWPHAEHQLGVLLGVVMKGDPGAALSIFAALRSARVQHDAVVAASEIVVSTEDNRLLAAILAVKRP
jgi:hypothetical protein